MFHTLPVQSLSFSANSLPISTVRHNPRRIPAVHCRAATVENFSRCLSMPSSLYEVLKVNQSASPADIKKAYRRLAKIYHPDVADTSPDDRDFIQIHDAYETLSDPKARAMYDLSINLVARRTVARSTGSTSFSSTVGRRPGFYTTRRWDSDQCW